MMKVSGTNNNMQAGYSGMNMQTDSVSKNIQNQIEQAQKKLQELASREDMTPEEKKKKRQEIQQEITMLNQQLRQHQMELRKEQQAKKMSPNDLSGGNGETAKENEQGNGFSQAGMQALISADTSMKLAKVQGGQVSQMKGRAGVLESEIKTDKGRGASTEMKEKELADLLDRAKEATASQISSLASANKAMKEKTNADQEKEKSEESDQSRANSKNQENKAVLTEEKDTAQTSRTVAYVPVDIRL